MKQDRWEAVRRYILRYRDGQFLNYMVVHCVVFLGPQISHDAQSMAVFRGQIKISSCQLLTQYEWPYKASGFTSGLKHQSGEKITAATRPLLELFLLLSAHFFLSVSSLVSPSACLFLLSLSCILFFSPLTPSLFPFSFFFRLLLIPSFLSPLLSFPLSPQIERVL